ncbi:MAG TPA: guanylate kinase [Candidatus Sulfotelmatobacter sp.]|nr:guanylate kinase [Candidatus Sulfotelmatobacter sp.]
MSAPRKPIVYIISAPSGSGKSTLVNEVVKLVPNLDFSISYTTRARRGSEQDGKQYHFVTREEFERMVHDNEFLEHAEFDGNYYGTARRYLREAERKGTDLLLDIDVQGAAQIHQRQPDAVSIFILPPDKKELDWRLRKRGENDDQTIQRRLDTASREIEKYDRYNYVLINDRLEKSIERLEAILLSERLRRVERSLSEQERAIVERADRLRLANVQEKIRPILDSFRKSPPPAQG